MADYYALQQQGVADGTAVPADKADGRQVGASHTITLASKPTDQAFSAGDRMYLGKRPAGTKLTGIKLTIGTSLSTTTIDIGDADTADKYVDGKTLTVVDTPTSLGPKASTLDDTPSDDPTEEIWATFLTTAVGAAVALTFELEFTGIS
ncbi:hypothetical protein [uncultured Sphingopyxis sp.]|jgi:hypothetical protein|uniref:hypothetical protein n=1 Tax=uncultured Sphingopyxis sp. TaxID=310581 RepID=UPI00259A0FBC|nr:hypothetical protein [uncultured Sphingopyxis sp.]